MANGDDGAVAEETEVAVVGTRTGVAGGRVVADGGGEGGGVLEVVAVTDSNVGAERGGV